jgi:hypothetical protein
MSRPDILASAALDTDHVNPIHFFYLDIVGDVVRVNSSGADFTPMGTGVSDLDGHLFQGIGAAFVDISSVRVESGGTESVTATLSGLPEIDSDTLNTLGDIANWKGRLSRSWRVIRDADNMKQGGFQHYHTGYMTDLAINGTDETQSITVTIETYLPAFSAASGRSYLDQERYDPLDLSARAAQGIVNGVSGNPVIAQTPTNTSIRDSILGRRGQL